MPGEEQILFLNKLGEIPVLNDGWFKAADYYSKVKEYNALMRLTLSMAETSVKKAGELSVPVLNHYQPQITNIDGYACKKLEQLESKYPLIRQPTEQWKDTCVEFVDPVVGRVKPVISQVQDMVNNGKQRIENIKTASTNIVEKAKNTGVGTATNLLNATFETYPGRFVTRTVDGALVMAEDLVDKYLPEEQDKTDAESDTASDCSSVEQMEEMEPTPQRVFVHAGCVTEKIRKRMFRMAVKDMTYAKSRATAALNRMKNTVDLAELAKQTNLTSAKDKVDQMWTEIVKESQTSDKTVFNGTIEDRIVALGQLVARQVKFGVVEFEKAYEKVGQFKMDPISKTKEYKELIATFITMDSIKTLTAQSLEKVKESLAFVQDRIQGLAKLSPSLDWVAVDVNMEDISLSESDLGMEQVLSTNNNSEDELEREGNSLENEDSADGDSEMDDDQEADGN